MALITRFDTPGRLRDVPESSPFYDQWHSTISGMLDSAAINATPIGDGPAPIPGSGFYNPSVTEVNVVGSRALMWMGFPRQLTLPDFPGDRREALRKGETRGTMPEGKSTQVEYLEWFTQRDDRGRIIRVTFTTESPEYWNQLFLSPGGPEVVLGLYRQLLDNPKIELAEITDSRGNYNILNPWNTTRGIIHYIVDSPSNTIGAALGLAAGALIRGAVSDNFQFVDSALTSADARVTFDSAALGRKVLQITGADPISLYIAGWDDTGWTKPDGSPVGDYWQVVRPSGASGPPALRLVYEVPASEGFVVSDIRIGGRPIEFGGQIAEHLTVTLTALAGKLP